MLLLQAKNHPLCNNNIQSNVDSSFLKMIITASKELLFITILFICLSYWFMAATRLQPVSGALARVMNVILPLLGLTWHTV